jgi:NTE family protein
MGSGNSKSKTIKNLEHENIYLKQTINELTKKVYDQLSANRLLNDKINAELCIKDGMCQNINDDLVKDIEIAKHEYDYDYIVLSGGGIKGISYCGAMKFLEEMGILHDDNGKCKIKGYAGTSAGAIIATLLAVGYTSEELLTVLKNLNIEKLFDDKIGYMRDSINFIIDWGIAPGDYLMQIMGELIEHKTGDKDYTLAQLYEDKGVELVLVGADMNYRRSRYFSWNAKEDIDRNISLRKGVRISMSFPILFEPVQHGGSYCVDGGVLDNFPLHVFDGEYPGDIKARLNVIPVNPRVLGLNIMAVDELESYAIVEKQNISSTFGFMTALISTLFTDNERRNMTPSYWLRTINIVTPSYGITKFSLTCDEKEDLINRGYKHAKEFFTNK